MEVGSPNNLTAITLGSAISPSTTAKRNARERRRVQAVNEAFCKLRRLVPLMRTKDRDTSTVKMLSATRSCTNTCDLNVVICKSNSSHSSSDNAATGRYWKKLCSCPHDIECTPYFKHRAEKLQHCLKSNPEPPV
ncbi:hypothetical protein M8J77_003818 [Diaphorina citri]|nr:hypothetical protein M8J77_003818 [Diaphorina citri]